MKPYNGFSRENIYKERDRLPAGGYVLEILNVQEQPYSWGTVLIIEYEIAEGEYKGYFQKNLAAQQTEDKKWKGTYRLTEPKEDGSEQDERAKRKLNTFLVAVEESNPGYHWDWRESTLKGKKVGALFNNKEYELDGRHGFYTNCHSIVPAAKIREGRFTIPADTLLKKKGTSPVPGTDGFLNIPDGFDDELPF